MRSVSTYPIRKLLTLWEYGKITTEQAIGHMMQHLLLIETARWEELPPPTEGDEDDEGDGGQGARDEGSIPSGAEGQESVAPDEGGDSKKAE